MQTTINNIQQSCMDLILVLNIFQILKIFCIEIYPLLHPTATNDTIGYLVSWSVTNIHVNISTIFLFPSQQLITYGMATQSLGVTKFFTKLKRKTWKVQCTLAHIFGGIIQVIVVAHCAVMQVKPQCYKSRLKLIGVQMCANVTCDSW